MGASRVPMERILIVRLGSLGDIVHALPAVAALRATYPRARIDWLVDARHVSFLRLVPTIDTRIEWRAPGAAGWRRSLAVIRGLRATRYDAALDLQGLLKSAVLSRGSGARRAIGFSAAYLREPGARWLYHETVAPAGAEHVVQKNLSMARALGAADASWTFPIDVPPRPQWPELQPMVGVGGDGRFALLNPGAAWPNKRWPPERFGRVAAHLQRRHGLPSLTIWGPGERDLAVAVERTSDGAAVVSPETSVGELVALAAAASVIVAGDTGPLHIAAAVGTPVVGLFGPTDPARNGPWAPDDVVVSRVDACHCHHKRSCLIDRWCLADIAVSDVEAAVDRRLAGPARARPDGPRVLLTGYDGHDRT